MGGKVKESKELSLLYLSTKTIIISRYDFFDLKPFTEKL